MPQHGEMAGFGPTVEDGPSLAAEQKTQELERKLSEALGELKKDNGSPDNWMKAARAYLALGDLDKALKCGKACLEIDERRRDAKLLVADVKKLLEAHSDEEEASGEDVRLSLPINLWAPEWERLTLSEEEALEELRRALNPSMTVLCPHCNTLVEVDKEWCHGCGRKMEEEVETLEQKVDLARAKLKEDEEDKDALFTMGAYLAVNGEHEGALETLNRLSILDQRYPGLWWLKARVFELMGKREAARSALSMAAKMEADFQEMGSEGKT